MLHNIVVDTRFIRQVRIIRREVFVVIRTYKMESPGATIQRARSILAEAEILACVSNWCMPHPGLYSVRLIQEDGCRSFSSNGKGRTRALCLASAYAELLERIQNSLPATRLSQPNLTALWRKTGHCFHEDEVFITPEQFPRLPPPILSDFLSSAPHLNLNSFTENYFDHLRGIGLPGCPAVPFFDARRGCNQLIPYELLTHATGTNGMAAGNTIAEAAFQALCEVMERWAAAEIFFGQMTPAVVSRSILRLFPDEWDVIIDIEAKGAFEVRVMDFSAGLDLPVLGIMVINPEKDTYRLNIACDTSFQIALSRGLTELYQGLSDETFLDVFMLPIPREEAEMFLQDDERARLARSREFLRTVKNGTGRFPRSLFAEKPDYAFDPNRFIPAASFEEELQIHTFRILESGRDVYFRSAGFMGFPAVMAYIPGVSRSGRKEHFQSLTHLAPWESHPAVARFCRLADCLPKEHREIAETLGKLNPAETLASLLRLQFTEESPIQSLPVSLAEAWILYSLEDFVRADEALGRFMAIQPALSPRLKCLKRWIALTAEGRSLEEIPSLLRRGGFSDADVCEIATDYAEPRRVFQLLPFPRCPHCEECTLASACLTRIEVRMLEKIRERFRDSDPSQGIWAGLLDFQPEGLSWDGPAGLGPVARPGSTGTDGEDGTWCSNSHSKNDSKR